MDVSKYKDLIATIKKRRRWVVGLTFAAIAVILALTLLAALKVIPPLGIEIQPVTVILAILLCLFVEVIAYASVSTPLNTAMSEECDPEKHLALNTSLSHSKNLDHIYTTDYLYMGRYEEALAHTSVMLESTNDQTVLAGLFNKARCEFFTENREALQQTTEQYKAKLSDCKKLKPKVKMTYERAVDALDLMCAIADGNTEEMRVRKDDLESWSASKATVGFVDYIIGLAAYKTDDRELATDKFTAVKQSCAKTVLAKLSEEYLTIPQ